MTTTTDEGSSRSSINSLPPPEAEGVSGEGKEEITPRNVPGSEREAAGSGGTEGGVWGVLGWGGGIVLCVCGGGGARGLWWGWGVVVCMCVCV